MGGCVMAVGGPHMMQNYLSITRRDWSMPGVRPVPLITSTTPDCRIAADPDWLPGCQASNPCLAIASGASHLGVLGEAERVERAARVLALLRVRLCVALCLRARDRHELLWELQLSLRQPPSLVQAGRQSAGLGLRGWSGAPCEGALRWMAGSLPVIRGRRHTK